MDTNEKRIEYTEDGIRILSGYTKQEYMDLLVKEAEEAYKARHWQAVAQRQPIQKRRRSAR